MPDNPLFDPMDIFFLSDLSVISLGGPDALAFAHAQFANDVVTLPDKNWQWNAWLNAKGRVIMLFALLRLSEQQLLLVSTGENADADVARLQQFVLRKKVEITSTPGIVKGAFTRFSANADRSCVHIDENGVIALDLSNDARSRTLFVDPNAMLQAAASEQAALQWRVMDFQSGLPYLSANQRERWTPQHLSLERLSAFSVKKGCYPGQEVVARTHFLGQAKRGLTLLEPAPTVSSGMDVFHDRHVVGRIICVAGSDPITALAVTTQPLPECVQVRDDTVPVARLISGLQR